MLDRLKAMFLPSLSVEGAEALRAHPNFVRSQLMHHGQRKTPPVGISNS